ncbi:hypothetical protein TeGR_g5041 [Tetraparma gracilis]|uniref:Uncharacterized protein n=1 Tax=Tetraparma gracilis TaxID=2962635 RepID=A0ABQ6MNT0_9STRA|nr:hypothetical protein TeGR_g5041 [Tetraparma gracilis]
MSTDASKKAALSAALAGLADPSAYAKANPVDAAFDSALKSLASDAKKKASDMVALSDEDHAAVIEEMKAVAEREGLTEMKIEFPKKIPYSEL